MDLKRKQVRTWCEIDLDAIATNYDLIPFKKICVVKANAYGHGAVFVAKYLQSLGANYFAVSSIEEGIQLRENGINSEILILGYTPPECALELNEYDLIQSVFSLEYASLLSRYGCSCQKKVRVHIKIDTGMGRIGFQYNQHTDEMDDCIEALKLPWLTPEGIFTHFAVSDEGINDFTFNQHAFFEKAVKRLGDEGFHFNIVHCSNSGAILNYPSFHHDMVRAGLVLYGVGPTGSQKHNFQPAMSLYSVVSHVKYLKEGDSVSYGRVFIAKHKMRVATVSIGYADGFLRSNSGGYVYINNTKCRILGRICMDQLMVECDDYCKIGDKVEIFGKHITIEEVASRNGTIPYEIMCLIGSRVPRVYKKGGEIIGVCDALE